MEERWRRLEEATHLHATPLNSTANAKLLRCLPNPNPSASSSFTPHSLFFTGLVQARNGKRVGLRVALNALPLKPSELSLERPLASALEPQPHAGLECQRCSILVSPSEVVDSATELVCLHSILHSPTHLDSSSRARVAGARSSEHLPDADSWELGALTLGALTLGAHHVLYPFQAASLRCPCRTQGVCDTSVWVCVTRVCDVCDMRAISALLALVLPHLRVAKEGVGSGGAVRPLQGKG